MYRIMQICAAVLAAVVISGCTPADKPNPTPNLVSKTNPTPKPVDKALNYKLLKSGPGFKTGMYTAGPYSAVATIIQKNVAQGGASFYPMTLTLSTSQALDAEFTVPSGGTVTLSDAIGNMTAANVQMLYVASDNLDVTLALGTTTSYGTGAGTMSVLAGAPYEWDVTDGTKGFIASSGTAIGFTNWQSMSIVASTTASLTGGTAASTSVHIRSANN